MCPLLALGASHADTRGLYGSQDWTRQCTGNCELLRPVRFAYEPLTVYCHKALITGGIRSSSAIEFSRTSREIVEAPNSPTTIPAARFPSRHAFSSDSPAASDSANVATTVSPAPSTS